MPGLDVGRLLEAITPADGEKVGTLDPSRLDREERRLLVAHLDAEGWTASRIARLVKVDPITIKRDNLAIRRRRGLILAGTDGPELAAEIDARFQRLREKQLQMATSADNALADVLKLLKQPLPDPGTEKESRRAYRDAIARRDSAIKEAAVMRIQASAAYREARNLEESKVKLFQSLGIVRKEPDVLLVAAEIRSQREGVLRAFAEAFEGLDVPEDQKQLFRAKLLTLSRPEGGG